MNNTKKGTASRKRGFTLIELLVVVAIIGLLAAILFPVFARARESARRASCASNLKQIGLAFVQYAQDFDEKYPMVWIQSTGSAASLLTWENFIEPYTKNTQIFDCPSSTVKGSAPNYYQGGYAVPWINFPFTSPNNLGFGSYSFGAVNGGFQGGFPLHMSKVTRPSELVMTLEEYYPAKYYSASSPAGSVYYFYNPFYYSGEYDVSTADRHLETLNVLFIDGHVKALKKAELKTNSKYWVY